MNQLTDILQIEILDRNIKLYLPLTLEKTNTRQYIAFFELLYKLENKEITFHDFTVLVVYKFLNLKKGKRKLSNQKIQQAYSNIHSLAGLITNHFFSKENDTLSLKLDYKQNHISYVDIPILKKYYGPQDYYKDVTFGEYEDGLNIFFQYNETPSKILLQQLMATFYRPNYSHGRKKYQEHQIPETLHKFSNVPIGVLYGFFYNFAAFHTYFSSSQVYYNGKIIDLSILFEDQPEDQSTHYQSPYPSLGIKSTGIEIAKTGVLGNLQEVRNTLLWEVALLLYDMRKKDLDQRAQTNQSQKAEK